MTRNSGLHECFGEKMKKVVKNSAGRYQYLMAAGILYGFRLGVFGSFSVVNHCANGYYYCRD
jgi:hypothetical protein